MDKPISEGFKEDLAVAENAFQRILGRVLEMDSEEYHDVRMVYLPFLEVKKNLETRHEEF